MTNGGFDSLRPQQEPVFHVAGGSVAASAKPQVRGELADLVADVGEDVGVRRILHHEAGLAVEPARLHADMFGDGSDAAQPAVGEGAVAVKGLALPDDTLQTSLAPRVLAVGINNGTAGGADGGAADGALAEQVLPAAGCGRAVGRGAGQDRGYKGER